MDKDFEKTRVKPGQEGFQYDKRVLFAINGVLTTTVKVRS
jgi:hypothetical protein